MINGGLVSLGSNKRFQTLKHHNFLSALRVRFVTACSKVPMGWPSGSLLNHTPSLQLSICDRMRFRPAVASSLFFHKGRCSKYQSPACGC